MPPGHEGPAPDAAFDYPDKDHERRHGPRGYADDEHYKPWLRDEFDYRCVYCLCREVWFPDRQRNFSIDHVLPRSLAPTGPSDYDTLAYACCQCNSFRKAATLPQDPALALAPHLRVTPDGTIQALTLIGAAFIGRCALDRADLTAFRKLILETLAILKARDNGAAAALLGRYLAWPDDLPDLSILRPPGGNGRPEGVAQSAFARRQRGELPLAATTA
jgi:hypothetical protein